MAKATGGNRGAAGAAVGAVRSVSGRVRDFAGIFNRSNRSGSIVGDLFYDGRVTGTGMATLRGVFALGSSNNWSAIEKRLKAKVDRVAASQGFRVVSVGYRNYSNGPGERTYVIKLKDTRE